MTERVRLSCSVPAALMPQYVHASDFRYVTRATPNEIPAYIPKYAPLFQFASRRPDHTASQSVAPMDASCLSTFSTMSAATVDQPPGNDRAYDENTDHFTSPSSRFSASISLPACGDAALAAAGASDCAAAAFAAAGSLEAVATATGCSRSSSESTAACSAMSAANLPPADMSVANGPASAILPASMTITVSASAEKARACVMSSTALGRSTPRTQRWKTSRPTWASRALNGSSCSAAL